MELNILQLYSNSEKAKQLLVKSSFIPLGETNNLAQALPQMQQVLDSGKAAGIAAVQLGFPISVIGFKYGMENKFIVNPEIAKFSEKLRFKSIERCLSINAGHADYLVWRYKIVKLNGFDLNFNPIVFKAHGRLAAVLQHEFDHTLGMTLVQRGLSMPK